MSTIKPISVKILNKEYSVSCPLGSEEHLFEAAYYLDQKIREIRKSGRVIGLERMSMMAALNIASELLTLKHQKEEDRQSLTAQIEQLQDKIDGALENKSKALVTE